MLANGMFIVVSKNGMGYNGNIVL